MTAQADLALYLQSASFAVGGTTLFYDGEPDVVDYDTVVTTLYGYGGEAGDYVQSQVLPAIDTPRVQVVCRSRDAEAAWEQAEQAYVLLHATNQQFDGDYYTLVRPMQRPFVMGRDGNARFEIGFNLRARRRN